MATLNNCLYVLLVSSFFVGSLHVSYVDSQNLQNGLKTVCYYTSWSSGRNGRGKFNIEDINPALCTHLIYSFVQLSDTDNVDGTDLDWNGLGSFVGLRSRSPGTKFMVAIGGGSAKSTKFTIMANKAWRRAKFIDNIVRFLQRHKFDGLDLDWEYPAQMGGQPSDKEAYVKLIAALRARFNSLGFLLSAAVAGGPAELDISYDVPRLNQYLHFINLMAYDFHGYWTPITGENAPLYRSYVDKSDYEITLNVDYVVTTWLNRGAAPENLVLGMGSYGQSFTLRNPDQHRLGDPTTGPGNAGPYTKSPGMLAYNEICLLTNWKQYWDEQQKVPFTTRGNQWVGYDNVTSITVKSKYLMRRKLGGAMMWSIDMDDFRGDCGEGSYPLLQTINNILGA